MNRTAPESNDAATAAVSVVLPAFNLAGEIARTIAALRAELQPIAPRLEFVVVDDGSTDATARTVLELCQTTTDVRLLRNHRNLGKGATVYLGILAARHPRVCFTDADLAFTPGSYASVVRELLAGHDFVVASRRLPDSRILVRMEVLGYAARRHFVGVAFNRLVRASLRLPFRDTQCGLKAFRRDLAIELFRRVRSPRFLFDIELFLAARHAGVTAHEVPVCIAYEDVESSVRVARDSLRMLLGLAQIWRYDHRGFYRSVNPDMDPEQARGWCSESGTA
jgi:glycosyltransferase involved in cell wall biosynthesis